MLFEYVSTLGQILYGRWIYIQAVAKSTKNTQNNRIDVFTYVLIN
jgi:hypothetical protein